MCSRARAVSAPCGFSLRLEGTGALSERVTVRFVAVGSKTEVTVFHERIPAADVRARHEQGWNGCLDGLARYARAG